jgi:acyl phosphate:glycerol-3-phosphate acyltransferase
MDVALAAVCGYLFGAIPVGVIVTKLLGGVDIRDYGSGKTGFTNSLRVLGFKRSLPVFLGDFGKGLAAVLLPLLWTDDPWARAAAGVAAIVGHAWPIFSGFRGGRGLLAGAGALVGLNPLAAIAIAPVILLTIAVTRYVSLGSILAAFTSGVVFTALAAADVHSWAYAAAAALGGALIIALHHDNIGRLLAGTERKLGKSDSQVAT